jgi:ATP-binding cassette subfamily F protein 3
MLTAHRISKAFGHQSLLKEVTFHINPGDRVGLVGPNGCGKTTLLRLCAGLERSDSGHVALAPADLRLGYLAQGDEFDHRETVGEVLGAAGADLDSLTALVGALAEALAREPGQEAAQSAYDEALGRLRRFNAGRAAAVLDELGLAALERSQPVARLSGGQKTRLALAEVLLAEPDLLLLDEPTNHLDIGMLEWLEAWLDAFPGAALIVSHDRTFLDRTVSRILDLDPDEGRVREYAGNYSDYVAQYAAARARHWDTWRDQQAEIRRMEADIRRTFAQARHVEETTTPRTPGPRRVAKKVARKAKSREKKLERYLESPERVEKPTRHWQVKLAFDAGEHVGQDALLAEDLAVGYDQPLLAGLNLAVQAGERIVLTGANGAGKTTLLRTIAGQLPPLNGRLRLGHNVRLGYMTQEQEGLVDSDTPLHALQRVAPMSQTDARSFLHYFLFAGDDVLRRVDRLSYGERSRLSLALLVAQGCSLLLLDEPINHLDIASRERFEQALAQYEGTVIAVVHDRTFISRFATRVWWAEAGAVRVEWR